MNNAALLTIQRIESELEKKGLLKHPDKWFEPEYDIMKQLAWVFEVNNTETEFNWSPNGCVTKKVVI